MVNKTSKYRSNNRNKSIKTHSFSGSIKNFHKEVTIKFLEMLLAIKLYHWKTTSYATHKATDELYTKLNENMDSFIEILLGKTESRINLLNQKSIKLMDMRSLEEFKKYVMAFKQYLISLDNNKAMRFMKNSDLYNIRDTILGDMNQLLYLLTFK
jgi:DNA-binding ferritin-like protein